MKTRLRNSGPCFTSLYCSELLNALDTEVSRSVRDCLYTGRHVDLLKIEINPRLYEDRDLFFRDYFSTQLLSKADFLDLNIDRVAVALERFNIAEKNCADTNQRIEHLYLPGKYNIPVWLTQAMSSARDKIERALGPFSWDQASKFFGFGPGSSLTLPRSRGDAVYKFGNLKPTTTKANFDLAVAAVSLHPGWKYHLSDFNTRDPSDWFEIVPGNKVTTVPKSAKTDRVIAIEPDMNMFIQKGIGGMIRNRLKRVGVNLDDQTRNQTLAQLASLTGDLATVDLSMASDTMSLELVRFLLPSDWCYAIEQTRSPFGALPDGSCVYYQKVSSMGNGFTFELESLVFWALSSAVIHQLGLDQTLSIYGDDIVLPSRAVPRLSELLEFCGFSFNPQKSFSDGPFRESCGKHYFRGSDVTPIYVKQHVDSPARLIWFANCIRRSSQRLLDTDYGCSSLFQSTWELVVSQLPRYIAKNCLIPLGYGDSGLLENFDKVTPNTVVSHPNGWEGYVTKVVINRFKKRKINGWPAVLRWFSANWKRCDSDAALPGSKIPFGAGRMEVVKLHVKQWDDVGPWI